MNIISKYLQDLKVFSGGVTNILYRLNRYKLLIYGIYYGIQIIKKKIKKKRYTLWKPFQHGLYEKSDHITIIFGNNLQISDVASLDVFVYLKK